MPDRRHQAAAADRPLDPHAGVVAQHPHPDPLAVALPPDHQLAAVRVGVRPGRPRQRRAQVRHVLLATRRRRGRVHPRQPEPAVPPAQRHASHP